MMKLQTNQKTQSDPGSAPHHFVLRRIRDDDSRKELNGSFNVIPCALQHVMLLCRHGIQQPSGGPKHSAQGL
jgi:hypothetical protein